MVAFFALRKVRDSTLMGQSRFQRVFYSAKNENATNSDYSWHLYHLAEREGFEPSIQSSRIQSFQDCSFDHSDTFPCFNAQM